MKRWFAIVLAAGLGTYCSAAPHAVLWIARGVDGEALAPLAVSVDGHWSSINPSASPAEWLIKDLTGEKRRVAINDLRQTACGPLLVTDQKRDLSGLIAMNPGVRMSYFHPLPESVPLLRELTAAVKGKGNGKWSFQVTEPLAEDWQVYGYQERLTGARETGILYGLIYRHGLNARLKVFDVGESYEGAKGVLPGGMVGLFVWNGDIYLVEDQQNGDAITSRLILVDDHPHEVFKRECDTL